MEKVKVQSMVPQKVSVISPELRFQRTWGGEGAIVSIDKETLEDLMYDIGFRNMLEMGILYIADMNIKKELGLEPEDAAEPTNIIPLTPNDKKQLLELMTPAGFKERVKKMSKIQCEELCNYAITNRIVNIEKANILKEACGRDILTAIRLSEADKEA